MRNKTFDDIIGQNNTVELLSLYIDAYKETERLPFLLFQAARGNGKSNLVRKFREGLRRKDGSRPPILEINCGSIKNSQAFFDQVYPIWVNNNAFLFFDEIAELPHDFQTLLLTILEVKKDPIRTVDFNGVPYTFDFNKISFCGASTDGQKLLNPLQDRLRTINLEKYTDNQLFEIFENNLEYKVEIKECAKEEVISSFRGNPRDAVVKAEDLKTYSSAKQCKEITKGIWNSFSRVMGILPYGLSSSEIQVLKTVGFKREASLNEIASVTGFERSLIQKSLESILIRKDLLSIQGKRVLTPKGWQFYHQYCK